MQSRASSHPPRIYADYDGLGGNYFSHVGCKIIYQESEKKYVEETEEKFLNDRRSGNRSYTAWKLPDKIYIYLCYLYYTRIYIYISRDRNDRSDK